MSAGAAAPERRPRLNPFAFPSDTAFRFGLLVAAVLGANLYVWQWIASRSRSPAEHVAGTRECLAFSPSNATSIEQLNALTDRFSACTAQLYRYQVWWMLGGTAALLLAAAAIMVATPLWITRRRQLQPLTAEDAPAVVEEVAELAREQGLDPPRLFWNPLDASAGGLAFGHPGRYSVAIGRRARREAGRRPARVPSCRPARARAHPQSRRRDHVLHARGLVRVPPGRRHALHGHAARRRTAAEGHVAAGSYSRSSST